MNFEALTAIAFTLYLASACSAAAGLFLSVPAGQTLPVPSVGMAAIRMSRPFLLAGIASQFLAIGAWCVTLHSSPFAGPTGTLSVLAWAIAIAFAVLDFRSKLPAVGAVALLVSCLVIFLGVLQSRQPLSPAPALETRIITVHVLTLSASFALFAVAFGCAALYLLQNRLLRQHPSGTLFRRLPPLATLDSVAFHCVAFALPLLTIGLAIGLVQAMAGALHRPFAAWMADPRILLSFLIWLLYILYMGARLLCGWRGVRLQYILVVGLVVTLLLYVAPTSAHRFN